MRETLEENEERGEEEAELIEEFVNVGKVLGGDGPEGERVNEEA